MKPSVALPTAPAFLSAMRPHLAPLIDRYRRENKMHSTLLFTGIEGVGKKSIALDWIRLLFCDELDQDQKPCDHCKSCKRAQSQQWLDLYWYAPEAADDEKLGTHKIEPFRELKTKLGMGATEEPFKVVVIADADRMTTAAANSILKMLEEPPKGWLFLLTASDSSRLLPTILSRCLEVRIPPLSAKQIFSILKESQGLEFNSQKAEVASRAAMGSLRRAFSFLEPETWELRNQLLGLLSNPVQDWMKLVDKLSSSQSQMILVFDLIESIMHDCLMSLVRTDHTWVHQDQKAFLQQWLESKQITTSDLELILQRIAENRPKILLPLNSKLLVQQTLIPLLESIF